MPSHVPLVDVDTGRAEPHKGVQAGQDCHGALGPTKAHGVGPPLGHGGGVKAGMCPTRGSPKHDHDAAKPRPVVRCAPSHTPGPYRHPRTRTLHRMTEPTDYTNFIVTPHTEVDDTFITVEAVTRGVPTGAAVTFPAAAAPHICHNILDAYVYDVLPAVD